MAKSISLIVNFNFEYSMSSQLTLQFSVELKYDIQLTHLMYAHQRPFIQSQSCTLAQNGTLWSLLAVSPNTFICPFLHLLSKKSLLRMFHPIISRLQLIYFLSLQQPNSATVQKEIISIYGPLCLASFTQCFFKVYSCCRVSVLPFFLCLNNISLWIITVYLFIS